MARLVAAVATILTDKLGIDRRIEENLPNVSNAILIFSGWRLLSGSRPSPKRQVTRSLNKGNGKRPMVLKITNRIEFEPISITAI